jgi:hypothetical protein
VSWLVTVILALHFAYLAYVVLGGFLAWRWPRAFWLHLAACGWGALIVAGWVDCPLTWAEDWARQQAGQTRLTAGFVDRYLDNVIYPERYVNVARVAVALVVGGSWLGAYVRWRSRRRRIGDEIPERSAGPIPEQTREQVTDQPDTGSRSDVDGGRTASV